MQEWKAGELAVMTNFQIGSNENNPVVIVQAFAAGIFFNSWPMPQLSV